MKKNLFKKAGWINNSNVYEVNLRQYTKEGTINAFTASLPRLRKMGVETLWFMPITPIAQENKKGSLGSYYACSSYTAISEEFGTLDDFRQLVRTAHGMGFKVILDWVANHTGWGHVWTQTNPDFYKIDEQTGSFKIASGMDDIIELNYDNPAMRKAMISAMRFWVDECDIDGFRCDLASWVTLDFWKEARTELEQVKTLFWLAEADVLESSSYLEAFDAAYAWTWMHKTEDYNKGKYNMGLLKKLLYEHDAVCGNESISLWFTSNHDENSWNGTEYEKYGDMLMALNVFSFTWNGMPMIYSGQELPNYKRLAFFDKDVITWNGDYSLEDFYTRLLLLKKENPALRAADEQVKTRFFDTPGETIVYMRQNGDHRVFVWLNFGSSPAEIKLDHEKSPGTYRNAFTGTSEEFAGTTSHILEPFGYRVFTSVL